LLFVVDMTTEHISPEQQEALDKVRARAAADPAFRQRLADDPRAAVTAVLAPSGTTGELSGEQLETVAGGMSIIPQPLVDFVDWVMGKIGS
jgi:hypothetical protein